MVQIRQGWPTKRIKKAIFWQIKGNKIILKWKQPKRNYWCEIKSWWCNWYLVVLKSLILLAMIPCYYYILTFLGTYFVY